MKASTPETLHGLYSVTGQLVRAGNRLFIATLALGCIFSVMAMVSLQLTQSPERLLHTQAFMFNYLEFSHVAEGTPADVPNGAKSAVKTTDPNWDGTLAGASLGMTLGRSIPVVGCVVGPVIGAMVGYKMDAHI